MPRYKVPTAGYTLRTITKGEEYPTTTIIGKHTLVEAQARYQEEIATVRTLFVTTEITIALHDPQGQLVEQQHVQGETPVPERVDPVGPEHPEKTRLRLQAEKENERYPQYRNFWNGPEWKVARCIRSVGPSKGGSVVLKGELVLFNADRNDDARMATVYARNPYTKIGGHLSVYADHFTVVA